MAKNNKIQFMVNEDDAADIDELIELHRDFDSRSDLSRKIIIPEVRKLLKQLKHEKNNNESKTDAH